MNWNEFKTLIDLRLQDYGLDGSVNIMYIDINFPDTTVTINLDESEPPGQMSVHN